MNGFVERAKAIFDRAEALAENEEIRSRVELERLPIMYVELSQLYKQLKDTKSVPDKQYFVQLLDRFARIADQHNVKRYATGRGLRTSIPAWIEELNKAIAEVAE